MIAQKIFRWWAQMAEDNLFHDILIIGTSSWDYEDNFDPISRKKDFDFTEKSTLFMSK